MRNKLAKFIRREAKKHGLNYKQLKKSYKQVKRESKK